MGLLKPYGIHLLALGIFLVLTAIFFMPQWQGQVVNQSDIRQYKGMAQEVVEYQEQTGEYSLWTNSMFGGMPTYQIRTVNTGNQLKKVEKASRFGLALPAGQYLAGMVGFYILMLLLGANPWMSILGAVAFAFMPFNAIWYEAGHITKVKTISYFPILAAGLILAFRGKYLWGGILFALGLGLNLTANHVQMTYYLFITMGIYGVARLIYDAKQGQLVQFAKAVAVLIVAGLLALGSTASGLWVTYEYQKDTMRGNPILTADGGQSTGGIQSSSETDGLSWDYAMEYSNGWMDIVAAFIPGVVGGGIQQPVAGDSQVAKSLRQQGYRVPNNFTAPLYWGASPFSVGPSYFGTAIALLFFMGLFLVKGPIKWWVGLGALLSLLFSIGWNFEGLNRFFFDYFPLFNKFRTPNSAVSIAGFLVPILSVLTLREIVLAKASKQEITRSFIIGSAILGGMALFFALLGPSFYDFIGERDSSYTNTFPQEALIADRKALMTSDAWRTLLFLGLSCGAIYLYLQKRIPAWALALGLAALTVVDLWGINRRYFNEEDYSPRRTANVYEKTPADEQILADPDPHFRVFDLSVNPWASSRASYFHKSIGGYHAAKLQRIQDIIDRHLSKNNAQVVNMFNIKYLIGGGPEGQTIAQRNPDAYGNAWFVDSLAIVASPNAEIDALNTINPRRAAVVHQEYSDYIAGLQPNGSGNIRLTEYRPNAITYSSTTDSEQLAVFSEVWYGPNKGWQAYIDGEPVDHIRVNYVLRALRVPAGQHTIEFKFAPRSYAMGSTISLISSMIILLTFLGWGGYELYRDYQKRASMPTPDPKPAPVATKKATTKRAAKPKTKKKKKK